MGGFDMKNNSRCEDYVLGCEIRNYRNFEKQQIARTLLNLRWTKHIPMGCDETGKGHREDISALDIDDGDQMLIFGSHSGSVSIAKYKHLERGKWKKPMNLKLKKQALKSIRWCPLDLRLFMVTTASGWMRVCDVTMEKTIQGKQFEGDVYFDWNEYNTTNSKVAVADGSRSMKIVDFRVGMDLPQTIRWDEEPIDVVQWYLSKHHYLYAGRRDGTIGLFDVRSTRGAIAQKQIHKSQLYGMKLSNDGLRIISGDRSGLIHVADTYDFSTEGSFRGDFETEIHRRPDLKVLSFSTSDIFVATNFEKLTVIRFGKDGEAENHQVNTRVLWDKPIVFRESSYELITGFNYNYLNILSFNQQEYDEEILF